MSATRFSLRELPVAARLALTLLLLVNLGGFVASGLHMKEHHQNRDEQPGLSMDDLTGAYHGVSTRAPLRAALEADHPAEIDGATALPHAKKTALLAWLDGDHLSENFDSLDLGDDAPAEILAAHCTSCHSRGAGDTDAKKLPLEYWDDVKALAVSREISPVDTSILLASTHTHAISLATITLLLAFMMLWSRWPSALSGGLSLVVALGLSADLAAWWLAREVPGLVGVIVAGGAAYALSMVLMMLLVIIDLWRPMR